MEPISPEYRQSMKAMNPALTDAEIDEYQLLLANRSPNGTDNHRLQELANKIKPRASEDPLRRVPTSEGFQGRAASHVEKDPPLVNTNV